jgi:Type II CAAX prenyl endopeptidase Rce1-like
MFGCAHGYEGIAGVLLIAAYGAMFSVLTLIRRGLRTAMIAHAWHDSVSGVALVSLRHYGSHSVRNETFEVGWLTSAIPNRDLGLMFVEFSLDTVLGGLYRFDNCRLYIADSMSTSKKGE